MNAQTLKIGIVAPGGPLQKEAAERVQDLAAEHYGARAPELVFHPQCFERWGHFAGTDGARADAFLTFANDDAFDAIWFARGGYGAARIVDHVIPDLSDAARRKTYLGYSDAGSLLGALYKAGCGQVVHGPMPTDINREGGDAAVIRALRYLVEAAPDTLDPGVTDGAPHAAFNITILCHLIGTPHMPDLAGHVLMLEEVSEHMYRIDRALCHLTQVPEIQAVAGLKLGRCTDIPENDPEFGQTEEEIARHWCQVSGIPYLGRADIGHDTDNKIVPFGQRLAS